DNIGGTHDRLQTQNEAIKNDISDRFSVQQNNLLNAADAIRSADSNQSLLQATSDFINTDSKLSGLTIDYSKILQRGNDIEANRLQSYNQLGLVAVDAVAMVATPYVGAGAANLLGAEGLLWGTTAVGSAGLFRGTVGGTATLLDGLSRSDFSSSSLQTV